MTYVIYICSNCQRVTVGLKGIGMAACICKKGTKKVFLESENNVALDALSYSLSTKLIDNPAAHLRPDMNGVTPAALAAAKAGLKQTETASPKTFGDARGVTPEALKFAMTKLKKADTVVKQPLPEVQLAGPGFKVPMVRSVESFVRDDKSIALIPGKSATAIVMNDVLAKKIWHFENTHMVVPASLLEIFRKYTLPGGNPLDNDTFRNRVIAWHMVNQGRNTKAPALKNKKIKFWMDKQKRYGYKNMDFGGRDLAATLRRIAADQQPNTSGFNAYDKKIFTNDRKNAYRLPISPSNSHKYYEYYVTHDSSVGKRISGGQGAAGTERLVIGPPDHLFFTWGHYDEGSWFKYSWEKNAWESL